MARSRDSRSKHAKSIARATAKAAPVDVPATPAGARAALALWIALGVLVAARGALSFVPSMWMWGLNLQRFLDPLFAWGPWLLSAIVLWPPVAKRLEPAWNWMGERVANGGLGTTILLALAGGVFVWASPDVVRYVGDFLLRQGTVEEAGQPGVLFPQALPLDVLLHYTWPSALQNAHLLDANTTARVIGALDAALLAVLSGAFARALGLRGAPALATAAAVYFGGHLGMFTGYSKAICELVVLVVAAAVFGVRMARAQRADAAGAAPLGLGVTLALGLLLHRSAVAMLPAGVVAWALWLGKPGARESLRKPLTLGALLVPLATLAAIGPRIVRTMLRFDAVHLAPAEVRHEGVLAAALAGTRTLDLLNLVLLLAPLTLAALAALVMLGRGRLRGGDAAVILALAVPLALALPFIHPAQGLFRDWDDFAPSGAALALVAAWVVGETLRGAGARRWLAVAATLAVASPALQWLAHFTDVDLGFRRVEAFMSEPPTRTGVERGTSWDYLGVRNFRLERWPAAAHALAKAAETEPSPRILQQWALAETMHENLREAQRVYHLLLAKDPGNPSAWLGLAAVTSRIPDPPDCRQALEHLLALQPGNAEARQHLVELNKNYPPGQ
ncbi:MAG TPA: hypothetical protein VL332_10110 [Candidatus Saccharimonadaceae bacterium]|jgi:hypothetical protein|nr:hypothetical protein [Candidatus Saccharimonadaceae bacterium]